MRRSTAVSTGVATVVVLTAVAVLGSRLVGSDQPDRGDAEAAKAFAAAWVGGTLGNLPWDPAGGPDPAAQVRTITAGLSPSDDDRPTAVDVGAVVRDRSDSSTATADLTVHWQVGAAWDYRTQLRLVQSDGAWHPVLSPATVEPSLVTGQVLRVREQQPARAAITDRAGSPIVEDRPVVTVGIQPSRSTDLAATVAQVAAVTKVDAAALLTRVQAAKPDAFVEVVTLRREAYAPLRDQLRPIPGTVFREGARQLAPTTAFARALLGTVGPATADAVKDGGGRVRADQTVGLSGLQKRFDAQLGGTPGIAVEVVDSAGTALRTVFSAPAVPGVPLQLTLDQSVQNAADAALATVPATKRSALVTIQPSTGDVLAVANAGPDGPAADRALTGRYPPGSTFKIATTLALLRSGLTPTDQVPCPASVTVNGKVFSNAEAEVLGSVAFSTDFADSCNTAFIGSAGRITGAQLQQAARDVGYTAYDLGVGATGGDVPASDDPVEHAATMIGQGKVLASPLTVAVSAATVASGSLHLPRLLTATPPATPGGPLPQALDLQTLTRLVVTAGTGGALRTVPGAPVSGKTGTAEFGTDVPPHTHAWFTGFSGDLAFVVLVEDGGFGGDVAAPVAATFLRALR